MDEPHDQYLVARDAFVRRWDFLADHGFEGPLELSSPNDLSSTFRYRHHTGSVAVEGVHDLREDAGTDLVMAYLVRLPQADHAWAVDEGGEVRLSVTDALLRRDPTLPDPRRMSKSQARRFFADRRRLSASALDEETRDRVPALLPDFLGGSTAIFRPAGARTR